MFKTYALIEHDIYHIFTLILDSYSIAIISDITKVIINSQKNQKEDGEDKYIEEEPNNSQPEKQSN